MQMSERLITYMAWQEDDWLDEILDFFVQVNAVVPSQKTLERISEQQREGGESAKAAIVLNISGEEEKSRELIRHLQADSVLDAIPLYLVGVEPGTEEKWRQACPKAGVIVINGHPFEFDYEAVFRKMEAEWEELS